MSKLAKLKILLAEVGIPTVLTPDEMVAKYKDILRYVMKYMQSYPEGKSGDIITYLRTHYPNLSDDEKSIIAGFARAHRNDRKVIDKLFAPNATDKDTTLLDITDVDNILTELETNFKAESTATDLNTKSLVLEKLSGGIVALEKTYQALATGLEENKLIELKQ